MSQSITQEIINLDLAINKFSEKMSQKLKAKARSGYRGWDDIEYESNIKKLLEENIKRLIEGDYNQAVDVANFAMMLDKINCKD